MLRKVRKIIYRNPGLLKMMSFTAYVLRAGRVQLPRDIVVCGMARSGSTLVMNIINTFLEHDAQYCYFYDLSSYKDSFDSRASVKKTHRYSYLLENRIRRGYTKGIFTYRHPFDVIASLIQRGWHRSVPVMIDSGLIDGMMATSILYMRIPQVAKIRYERLYEQPETVMSNLYRNLFGDNISSIKLDQAVELCRTGEEKPELSRYVHQKLPNPATGYHRNHVIEPKPGKYRSVLSREDIETLSHQRLVREYLRMAGYGDAE